jgi:hypothetical protein
MTPREQWDALTPDDLARHLAGVAAKYPEMSGLPELRESIAIAEAAAEASAARPRTPGMTWDEIGRRTEAIVAETAPAAGGQADGG